MISCSGIASGKCSNGDMIIHVPLVAPMPPLNCFRILLYVPIISIADMIEKFVHRTTKRL